MTRHLSVASAIDKNKVSSQVAWVVLLDVFITDPNTREVTEVLRIARNTESVLFRQTVYAPGNFEINIQQQQNSAPTASISADDPTRFLAAKMDAMAGGVMSEVQMTVVNTDRLDKPPELQERFSITRSSAKGNKVTFELGSENPLLIAFPKHRQFQDRCAWRFRGYGCGYNGPVAVCDYSKNGPHGCSSKSNTINFRALPGLVRMNL